MVQLSNQSNQSSKVPLYMNILLFFKEKDDYNISEYFFFIRKFFEFLNNDDKGSRKNKTLMINL
jgi:hypothetical protein